MNCQSVEKLLQCILPFLHKVFAHVVKVPGQLLTRKGLCGVSVCEYVCVCVYECMCVYISAHMCVYVCMCVCVCVCECVCVITK